MKLYNIISIPDTPKGFKSATWIWYGTCAITSLLGVYSLSSKIFLLISIFCYIVLLIRPIREAPFALLLLATGNYEPMIFLGVVIFLMRAVLLQRVAYIPRKFYGYIFILFIYFTLLSACFSWLVIEFRPLQTFLWIFLFVFPLTIGVLGYRMKVCSDTVAQYAIYLIVLQIIPVVSQIPALIRTGSNDEIVGTWGDADIVGFWGTALFMGGVGYLFLERDVPFWRILPLIIVGIVLAILASGKIYSISIIIIGTVILILSTKSLLKNTILFLILIIPLLLCIALFKENQNKIHNWIDYHLYNSRKITFLQQVFLEIGDYGFSDLIGVGPGMLGSRAANSVAPQDIIARIPKVPSFMLGATWPEKIIMKGMFDYHLAESIRWMSATIVFPFSGIGAVKGELGWVGLSLVISLMASLFFPLCGYYKGKSFFTSIAILMTCYSGLATIILAIFDTVWEMPKIMVFLGSMRMLIKGV